MRWRNLRRERSFFIGAPLKPNSKSKKIPSGEVAAQLAVGTILRPLSLLQRLQRDFFEKDDVVVAVVLQADVAFVGAAAVLRLKIKFSRGNGLAFGVIGDFHVVENHALCGPSRVMSMVFHSGPGLPGRASGLVREYSVPVT